MKRLLIILTISLLALSRLSAQSSCESLWNELIKSSQLDQPKSAIATLKQIEDKAQKEKSYGDLIVSLFTELYCQEEISEDSVPPMLRRMMVCDSLLRNEDRLASVMYRVAMHSASDLMHKYNFADPYEEYQSSVDDKNKKSLVAALLADEALAPALTAKEGTFAYYPLFLKGADSRYFNDDIISVIALSFDDYEPLLEYYSKVGRRQSACVMSSQMFRNIGAHYSNEECLAKIDSLISIYSDLPECGALAVDKYRKMCSCRKTAEEKMAWIDEALSKWGKWREMNELRDDRNELTQPEFEVNCERTYRSSSEVKIFFEGVRNMSSVKFKITPFRLTSKDLVEIEEELDDLDDYDDWDKDDKKNLKAYLDNKKSFSVTHTFPSYKDYEIFGDSLSLGTLPLGAYLVEAQASNKSMDKERFIFNVCDLKVLYLQQQKKQVRYVVVNATTGHPVPGAKLHILMGDSDKYEQYTTDDKGEYVFDYESTKFRDLSSFYATTDEDRAMIAHEDYGYFYSKNPEESPSNLHTIFTDRTIYRPGQTVHVAVQIYNLYKNMTEMSVSPSQMINVKLRDANNKQIADTAIIANEFGVASTDFVLPGNTLNGCFTISTDKTSTSIRVEEYVRPTFDVTIPRPELTYKDGDTISVIGTAKTYSGVPVSGGRVIYKVNRQNSWWWRGGDYSNTHLLTDTVYTDASGHFTMRMPMVMPKEKDPSARGKIFYWWRISPRFYDIVAEATVTDVAGESHSASLSLCIGNRASVLTSDLQEKYLGDSINTVTFTRRNQSGTQIAGKVSISIDNNVIGETEANKPFPLPEDLTSGKHTLKAICEQDTLEGSFVIFSMKDERPVIDTNNWWYQSSKKFPVESGKGVDIQFGTSARDVYAVYSLFSGDELIETGSLNMDSSLVHRHFEYKKEYGDGICYTVTWVRDGIVYTNTATITRTLPDKTLNLKWTTFRNRLLPGQKEEWRLSVTDKDGKPANANVLATLYDKSLDAIKSFSWSFNDPRYLYQPTYSWESDDVDDINRYFRVKLTDLPITQLFSFSSFNTNMSIGASGIVVDPEGEPVIGASITAKGTNNVTISDIDGKFKLKTSLGKKLVVSYIGYKRKEVVATCNMRIVLEEDYTHLNDVVVVGYGTQKKLQGRVAGVSVMSAKKAMSFANVVGNDEDAVVLKAKEIIEADDVTDGGGQGQSDAVSVRENLNETAFFLPQVHTDTDGIASLSFTLPESVTTWKFMAFANDKDMRNGMMTDEAIAQKQLMIQPRMPRFLREGDVAEIPATISNLSDKAISAKATLTLLDAETEKVVYTYSSNVNIPAGETSAVIFPYDSKGQDGKVLIARFTVAGQGFSDGEQHYLPVLSAKELVLATRTMILRHQGNASVDIASMIPSSASDVRLTTEYTDSPEWLVIQSLPYITEVNDDNAISLATAYYANSLASSLANSNPDIEQVIKDWSKNGDALQSALDKNSDLRLTLQNETPWVCEAENETAQKNRIYRLFDKNTLSYRLTDILDHLKSLQNSDGSWSWWKGMSGSRYMTLYVMEALLRINNMVGVQKQNSSLIARGWNYLDSEIAKDVRFMKKYKHDYISNFAFNYLYCRAISDGKVSGSAQSNIDYLMKFLAEETRFNDMESKAWASIILSSNGKKKEAREFIESIRQHTVYREDMGRYFDSNRVGYSWCNYRIPTQTAFIEALKVVEPEDTTTISEMQRWLLQSKRTQAWDTPINAIHALYAFFGNKASLRKGTPAGITIDYKPARLMVYTPALGYEKTFQDINKNVKKVSFDKQSNGESWANVFVQYTQPVKDIAASSTGLQIEREMSIANPKVGDKVTVTITITADRDYDFVTVTDHRPACFEPVNQLSGYRNGCYQVMRDSQSQYHYDMLRKGKHVITTEYYVSRAGTFTAGTANVQCAYAPEFTAHTTGATIKVTK